MFKRDHQNKVFPKFQAKKRSNVKRVALKPKRAAYIYIVHPNAQNN